MSSAELPTDVQHWWTATRYQLRFYLRTWRFLGLLLFFLIVGGAATGVEIYLNANGGSAAAFLASGLGNLGIFGIIIAAFIGGDAIAMDFGSGTGYYMLVLPVRRPAILLGRFAAAFATGLCLVGVYYVISIFGAVYFWGFAGLPWLALGESFLLAVLYGAAVLSTAFFFSSLFRSPAVSIVLTILILFLGFLIVDGVVGADLGYEPWFSVLYAGGVIGLVLVGQPHYLASTSHVGGRVITTHVWNPYIWEGTVIMLAYFVVFLLLSGVIYQFKESKG
ncbi:MAG TPA: ABC transporter permease [Thermoplasmata archaeon]|nr:ABC transporter permease [Thermoplasmata archaeon]